jgi:hypothetical protein
VIKPRINPELIFGASQAIISFSVLILAVVLEFDVFNTQSSLQIPQEALNFDVTILFISGIIFLMAAVFLIYDWWEERP